MELVALRTFLAVVEQGGIQSASRQLNTVQSNVTTRIKRLEEELEAELFYRQGRGLTLAPAGHELVKYARQILQLENQAQLAIKQVGDQAGELRIGSMESFAALRLAPALKELRKCFPKLRLQVETDTSAELIKKVVEHKLDGAFVGGPVEHPELSTTEILREELVLVYEKNNISDRLPLILFKHGCAYRERALGWQSANGHQVNGLMEFGSLASILGCVAAGLGCTLLPNWVATTSRYRRQLQSESIDARWAVVPTVLVRHRQGVSLKALGTLSELVLAQSVSSNVA